MFLLFISRSTMRPVWFFFLSALYILSSPKLRHSSRDVVEGCVAPQSPPHPLPPPKINISLSSVFQTSFFVTCAIYLLLLSWFTFAKSTRFVPSNVPLNLLSRKEKSSSDIYILYHILSLVATFLLIRESNLSIFAFFAHTININCIPSSWVGTVFILFTNPMRSRRVCSGLLLLSICYFSECQAEHWLCIFIITTLCVMSIKKFPHWIFYLLIILSHDVHENPGPGPNRYHNSFFTFLNWNINTLAKDDFSRIHLIEAHNSLFNYDIISLCETSLNDTNVSLVPEMEDYTFIPANHPDNVTHGGVGLFHKNSLPVKVRGDLSFDESIVLELKFQRKRIFFTVLYRSPSFKHNSPQFHQFISNFKNLHSSINAEKPYAMFFTGDFNGHSQLWWSDGDTNAEGREIEELFNELNLTQIISEPTNFTPNCRPSCIDLIATDQPNLILDSGTRPSLDSVCHHQIVHCKVNFRIPPPPPCERRTWHYQRANVDAIRRSLSNFPWAQHFGLNNDVDWQVKSFTEIILNIMSNFVPYEVKRMIPRDPPWIDRELKSKLNRKNRFYKQYVKRGHRSEDKEHLESLRDDCKISIELAKKSYLFNLGKNLNDPATTQKSYWKIISRVMNKCRAPRIPPLLVNNKFILECKEKAILFNDFFANQCKPIQNGSLLPQFRLLTKRIINNVVIDSDEILLLIRNTNPNKSNGPDLITGHMLHLCDKSIVRPLELIFLNILHTGTYPLLWKLANVTPVYKKNDKQIIKNYRPISLLPLCGKIFEKVIFNALYGHLVRNNLLTRNQSGFRPKDSCTNQLLYLVSEIHESFEDPKSLEVRAVFLDISKAFDKVWHEGLLFKLKQNGVHGNLLRFFESYLAHRHQRVALNGQYSDYTLIESGVPQGSVLGPLLFLIYINDLENGLKSNVKFFADDTMLYSIVRDATTSAADLNHDLELIRKWAYQWKMEFNPDPTKQATEVLFSCKRSKVDHPPLYFNGTQVVRTDEQKHLGLVLTPSLNFQKHLYQKIQKAKKNIGIIKHLSSFLPLKTLNQMYKTFVRPHLDYCDIIYHEPPKIDSGHEVTLTSPMEEVERVQYKGALAVSGAWQGTNRTKLYDELGWEPLTYRRLSHRVILLFKIINRLIPYYLGERLPPAKNPFSDNPITIFHEFRTRTGRFAKSFFPDAIKMWNTLMPHFQEMPTLLILKKHLLSLFCPNPGNLFNIFDPIGTKTIFQLRLGLSKLRHHKKNHNFLDTPTDICLCKNGVEDTQHFLFKCKFYAIHRAKLASSVVAILRTRDLTHLGNTEHLYLYGDPSLSFLENKNIILSTIQCPKDSKRGYMIFVFCLCVS